MTVAFSDYLRHNMDSLETKETVPFERELAHIKTYLEVEKVRFGDDLQVVYRIETTDFYIPVLTLQPIVENAVKHGVGKKEGGGTVVIATEKCDSCIRIVISDNGIGFDPEDLPKDARPHIGIENARKRLAALCNAEMQIESIVGKGTTVTIRIPDKEDCYAHSGS